MLFPKSQKDYNVCVCGGGHACAVMNFSYMCFCYYFMGQLSSFPSNSSILLCTIISGSCVCFSSSWLLYPLRCITIVLCLFLGLGAETISRSILWVWW